MREHHEYVAKLRSDGKAAAMGAVRGNEQMVGLVIYERLTDDEARRLANDDPAVKAGLLRPEFHRWWSAAHVLPK